MVHKQLTHAVLLPSKFTGGGMITAHGHVMQGLVMGAPGPKLSRRTYTLYHTCFVYVYVSVYVLVHVLVLVVLYYIVLWYLSFFSYIRQLNLNQSAVFVILVHVI